MWSWDETSNIQAGEIQIILQNGHHLANYNEIHENLLSSDKRGFEILDNRDSDSRGCTVILMYNYTAVYIYICLSACIYHSSSASIALFIASPLLR